MVATISPVSPFTPMTVPASMLAVHPSVPSGVTAKPSVRVPAAQASVSDSPAGSMRLTVPLMMLAA